MTMNDQSDEQAKQLPIVKTDVLGRIKIDPKHREAMLDAFELSGMSASAFALEQGTGITRLEQSERRPKLKTGITMQQTESLI